MKAQPLPSQQTIFLKQELIRLENDPNATFEEIREAAIAATASAMGDYMDYEYAQLKIDNLRNKK